MLPPLEIYIATCTGYFTRGGVYPYLLLLDTYFHFHVSNRATLLDFVQWYRVHQSITNHGVHSYHVLTPMSCDVPMHKCNLIRHCMSIPCHIYDECYMDNLIYAYNMHLKQLSHMLIISKHHSFNVNMVAHMLTFVQHNNMISPYEAIQTGNKGPQTGHKPSHKPGHNSASTMTLNGHKINLNHNLHIGHNVVIKHTIIRLQHHPWNGLKSVPKSV